MTRSDRDVAVAAVSILGDVLQALQQPSIRRAFGLTGRTAKVEAWTRAHAALREELEAAFPKHCSWCPDPSAPDPRFHTRGLVHQEAPFDVVHARAGEHWQLNRCGAEGGEATNDVEATCPACRAMVDAR